MTTAFSIRKPAYHKSKYSKPRAIQSPAACPSYTLLPPSPPHKHLQQQQHHSIAPSLVSSSVDSTLSINSRDVIVAGQWTVLSKIGEGSFGEVFKAEDIFTRRLYAIKRESLDAPFPQLKHESIMYDVLMGGPGIPQFQWYGEHDDFACIVIDLLGPNLKQVRETVSCMPLEIVMELGCQMVSILEHIHSRGIVYRDVKPDNFLFPATCHLPENNTMVTIKNISSSNNIWQNFFQANHMPILNVVDFGLATWWRNPHTNRPYPQSKRRIKNKTGTARYASLNVHRGKTHARRDDMESLGYLLVDLGIGSLPWTGIQARSSKEGWDRMRELKEDLPLTELCEGLPVGLMELIEYTRRLQFSDQPNYDYLRRLLRESCQPDSRYGKLVNPRDKSQKTESHETLPSTTRASNNNSKTSEEGVFVMDDLTQELSGMSIANGNGVNGDGGKRFVGRRRRSSNKKQQQQQHSRRMPPSPPSPTSFSMKKRGANATASITKNVGWNTHRHRHPAVQPHPTHLHDDWVHGNPKPSSWGERQSKPAWDDHRPTSWLWRNE